MFKNHGGVSLIELIASLAILALLSAGTLVIFHQIGYANTLKAGKLIDSSLSRIRIETMSKEQKQYLYLYTYDGHVSMRVSTVSDPDETVLNASGTKFSKNISLLYKKSGLGETTLTEGNYLSISFDREAGSIDGDLDYIKLVSANHTSKITLVRETGRHQLN